MTAEEIVVALKREMPELAAEVEPAVDVPTLIIEREQIVGVLGVLREQTGLQFTHLAELTATDWWPGEPRFQVIYHVTSIENRLRLRLKVLLHGEDAHIPTVSGLWPGANWLEREVYDMFGIIFDGHPDLRRVLMPEDWEGHPLRKDYPVQIKMPVKIYEPIGMTAEEFQKNIEADRDKRAKR